MIKSKLSIYKSFMYKEKILTSDERQLMGLNYWMWYSLDLHYMSYFVMGPKHKTELLVIASEVFDFIMKKFFSPKSLEEFFVSKPQMEIQNHYKFVFIVVFK